MAKASLEEFDRTMHEDAMMKEFAKILILPDIKTLMVRKICTDINTVIDMTRYLLYAEEAYTIKESQFNIFDWSLEKYKERVLSDKTYLDIYRLEDQNAMDIMKFLKDLTHLQFLLGDIVKSESRDGYRLKDCWGYFTILEKLQQELDVNTKKFEKYNENQRKSSIMESKTRKKKNILEDLIDKSMDEFLVIDPMIEHYTLKYAKTNHEAIEFEQQLNIENLENTLKEYTFKAALSDYAHEKNMSYLENEIEDFKHKIFVWTKKYDRAYEKYTYLNTNLTLTLRAMESNMDYYSSRLVFFRTELEKLAELDELKVKKAKETKRHSTGSRRTRQQSKASSRSKRVK